MTDPKRPHVPLVEGDAPAYSPVGSAGHWAVLRSGGREIRVDAAALEGSPHVVLSFGATEAGPLAFPAVNVTQWCAETSVLIEVTLEMPVRDELRIRSPMLVGDGARALAVIRQYSNGSSGYVIAVSSSASALAQEEYSLSWRASSDEVRTLLTVLESAAAATTRSRDARR